MQKDLHIVSQAFALFMESLGLDIQEVSLKDTPKRVAKMFLQETCVGLFTDPPKITTFPNEGIYHYNGIVTIKNLAIKSLCEHHFQPFIGKCHIGYIPKEKMVGLSKFSRIVDYRARRPQVQERLTQQIYSYLCDILSTEDVAIHIEAEHYCMKVRGVEEHQSSTVTSSFGGKFLHDIVTRDTFYQAIGN